MVSMTDHDVSEEDKRTLLNYLINSSELRDEFIEYENFEMISYQAASVVGLEVPVNTSEMNVADIPADEMPSDIAEEMLTASEIEALTEDDIVEEQDNKSGDAASGFVKGAAVLGAEIAGTAMASAALSGIAETADSAANIINAAANVANIEADAIDMASSIKNMAEQVFSDENNVVNEHVEVAELPEISEMPAIGNLNIDDFNAELSQAASLEGAELPEVGAEELVNEENSAVQESVQESAVEEQADSNADLVSDDGGVGEIDELPELGESPELAEVSEDMLQNLSEEDLSLDDFDAEVGIEEQAEAASEPDNSEEQTEQQVEQSQDAVEASEPVEQNDQSGIDEMPDDNLSEPLHSPQENMNSTLDELFADFDASEYSDENDDENNDENSDFSADATSDSNEDSIGDLSDASIDDLDSDSSDDSNNDLGDASIDDLGSELSDDSNNELSDDLINDLGSDSGDDSNNELSDDLISDFGSDSSDELSNVENNDDELVFSNSDDLVFENSDSGDDITYSNDSSYDSGYGDDLVFESSDGGFDDSFDNSPRRSRPVNPLAHGFHTPISEATELTSIEDIQMGNLPKQVTPPPVGDQMETMEMEEFHRLVRNYVPQEIKDESTNQTFKSEDLILWDGNKWILLGHASVKVNLSTDITDSYISINNSAGNGVVLPSATSTQAGLFSAADKSQFNTYKGISSLGDIITIDSGVSISYTEKVLLTGKETPRTLIFPAATDTINGVLLFTDKIKLNNLPEIISRSNIEYDGKDLCLINTEKNINTGLDSTDKIQLPIASYDTSNNYKSGLITGENTQKLENIESMITGINYAYEVDALKITYSKYNSNTRTSEDLGFILPIASNQTNGLLSRDDKIKLDKLVVMEQKQSDWKIEDPDDISFIKNKPSVLTSTSSKSSLIPSTLNITDKQVKFLNANGEWVDSTLSKPIITISPTEPTDENLKIDGAIWIQIPIEGD